MRGTGCGLEVTRASEGFVTRLPVEAADALVVDCSPLGSVLYGSRR